MKLNVKLDNNTLDQYDKALSTYKEWKSFYRDIKLSTLLEGSKVQLDIDEINKIGLINNLISIENPGELESIGFSISGMIFIIKGNSIEKLTLRVEFLKTEFGQVLKNIYEAGIEIEVRQVFTEKNVNFIIDIPKIK